MREKQNRGEKQNEKKFWRRIRTKNNSFYFY